MWWKVLLIVAAISVAGWAVAMLAFSLTARPGKLGLNDGRLGSCPSTPNCVCSQDEDAQHAIEPIGFEGDPSAAWSRLRTVLGKHPRTRVVSEADGYLHAECTSLLFRFVDDVEFLLDAPGKRIHVRSASRAGRSDLGVNRARVEAMREMFVAEGRTNP